MTQPDTLSSRLDALELLAKAATQGEWRYTVDDDDGKHVVWEHLWGPTIEFGHGKNGEHFSHDMRYIAAANPSAILALIGEVRDLLGRGK